MSEVVDIIHNLSYTVSGSENLKTISSDLQQNSKNIDLLKARLVDLNKQLEVETGAKQQQVLAEKITGVTTAIEKQSAAMKGKFAQNKPLQDAIVVELGLIQKLTDRINDLRHARERAVNRGQIDEINRELNEKKKELAALVSPNSSSPTVTSSFFGGQSNIGSQLLQGTLYGLGIGGGFGIVTRIVSEAIEALKGYSDQLIYSKKYQNELKDAIDSFAGSMTKQIDSLVEFNKTLDDAFNLGTSSFKFNVDAVKAEGVVRGEVGQAALKQFYAEQDLRKQQLKDVNEIRNKYQQVFDLFQKYDKGGDLNALRERLGGLGLSKEELRQFDETIDKFLTARQKLRTRDQKGFLLSEQNDIPLAIAKQSIEANKLNSAIENAQVAFANKLNEEIFQLDLKLKRELAATDQKFQQDKIKSQVTTAETIKKSIELETAFRLKGIEIEKEEQRRKFGSLPGNIVKEFSEKETQVKREQQLKQLVELQQYYNAQVVMFSNLQVELLQAQLKTQNQELAGISPLNATGNLDKQRQILDTELQLQLQTNSAKYSQEVLLLEKLQAERRKASKTETTEYKETEQQLSDIYQEFAQNEADFIRANNIKKLDQYGIYYGKFIKLVKEGEASVALAIATRFSGDSLNIAKDRGFNFLNRGDRQKIAGLRSDIDLQEQLARSARDAKPAAEEGIKRSDENAQRVNNNPQSSDAERKEATEQQQKALDEKEKLDKQENEAEKKSLEDKKAIRKTYFDAVAFYYQSLASTAVSAYQTISSARQRDLDHEIMVRTERLDMAFKLAERGNTQALEQEQKALNQARKQKREAALRDQEINAALTVSNALVAVAKAAAEGGVAAPATIALVIAAIGIGFAEANALSASQKSEFRDGGYTGDGSVNERAGTVHKGEFVFTKETTSKHRELFEAIHQGYDPMPTMALPVPNYPSGGFATKADLKAHGEMIVGAIMGKDVNVSQVVDKSGVHQIVTEQNRAHAVKWGN